MRLYAAPGGNIFNQLAFAMQIIGWKIPVRIADCETDAYPLGLGEAGKLSYHISVQYGYILNTGSQSVVLSGQSNGLCDSTDANQGCLTERLVYGENNSGRRIKESESFPYPLGLFLCILSGYIKQLKNLYPYCYLSLPVFAAICRYLYIRMRGFPGFAFF